MPHLMRAATSGGGYSKIRRSLSQGGIQKITKSQSISGWQYDSRANDAFACCGCAGKQLVGLRPHLRERQGNQITHGAEIKWSIAKDFRDIVRIAKRRIGLLLFGHA